ncbi:hypothetical protein HDU82_004984 [Entophlyctis luteolus]|nr:hypothetical protein HDU82_004984 [Entophlyctis luteolus]
MMKSLLLSLPLLLLLSFLCAPATGAVLVHKTFKEPLLVKGRNATVSITAFNTGDEPISNLVVHDKTFRNLTMFVPVAGKHSRLFKTIQPNESLSFWFVVKPTISGYLMDEPATYKYKDSADAEHNGISSYYRVFPVFTEAEAAKLGAKDKSNKWLILALAFGAVVSYVAYVYVETLNEKKLAAANVEKDE